MSTALGLLVLQGFIGAFDTIYYHEWKMKLPARGSTVAPELALHAVRDFIYGLLFLTLPWIQWKGTWTGVLVAFLTLEIVLTLWDFVVETKVRKPLGDVSPGERVTHAVLGIIYGAMLATLTPTLLAWWSEPTALIFEPAPIANWMQTSFLVMGVLVIVSGLRDLYASLGLPGGGWPWAK